MAHEIQVLVVGAESTGKTLLLKRLQTSTQQEEGLAAKGGVQDNKTFGTLPSTVPTVGTNLANVVFNKKKYNIRELGGAMAPIWKNYYPDGQAVIFVMDVSNGFQVSASTILFNDVLSSEALVENVPVLLLYNKMDLMSSSNVPELKFLMRINDILKRRSRLDIIECSMKSGDGVQEIIDWLTALS